MRTMKPFPFKLSRRVTFDVKVPEHTPFAGEISVEVPEKGEPVLTIGCQEHTLSYWKKHGEELIEDNVSDELPWSDYHLDPDNIWVKDYTETYHAEKPAVIPVGSRWISFIFDAGGWVHTPRTDEGVSAEQARIVAQRKLENKRAMGRQDRAMVTLPLLIAAIEDEVKALRRES